MFSSPSRYPPRFASVEEVDKFAASPSSPSEPATNHTKRTTGLAYYRFKKWEKAEKALAEHLAHCADDFEATQTLASTYEHLAKFRSAVDFYEKAYKLRTHEKGLLLKVARLRLDIIDPDPKTRSEDTCDDQASRVLHLKRAFHCLKESRLEESGRISFEALPLLDRTYGLVADSCPNILSQESLRQDFLAVASLNETRGRPALHVALLKALVRSNQRQAVAQYFIRARDGLRSSADWLLFALNHSSEFEMMFGRIPILTMEVKLWLYAHYIRMALKDPEVTEEKCVELLNEFDKSIKRLESLLPFGDKPGPKFWYRIREEYASHATLLRGLSHFRSLKTSVQQASDLRRVRPQLQAAVRQWRLCISYRTEYLEKKSYWTKTAASRLSLAAHNLLASLYCFTPAWTLGTYSQPSTDIEADAENHLRIGSRRKESNILPHFSLVDFPTERTGQLFSLLKWLSENLHEVDMTALDSEAADLGRFANVSAWHIRNCRLREILREVFPRLPESPQTRSPRKGLKAVFRHRPTVADMEAFIMMLLIQRHMWCCSVLNASSVDEVTFLSTLDMWKPTREQEKFWRTALVMHGKQMYAGHYLFGERLDEDDYYQAILEIRGAIRCKASTSAEERQTPRQLYGTMGFLYSEMSKHNIVVLDDAKHYLNLYLEWDKTDSDELPESLIVMPDLGQCRASFGVSDERIRQALNEVGRIRTDLSSRSLDHKSPAKVMKDIKKSHLKSPLSSRHSSPIAISSPLASHSSSPLRTGKDVSVDDDDNASSGLKLSLPVESAKEGSTTMDQSFARVDESLDVSVIQGSDTSLDSDHVSRDEDSPFLVRPPAVSYSLLRTQRHLRLLQDLRSFNNFEDPTFSPSAFPRTTGPPHPFPDNGPEQDTNEERDETEQKDADEQQANVKHEDVEDISEGWQSVSETQTEQHEQKEVSKNVEPIAPLPKSPLPNPGTGSPRTQMAMPFTPKRDPLELRGGRGDLSELKRRAVVSKNLNHLVQGQRTDVVRETGPDKPKTNERLAKQLKMLEMLRSLSLQQQT
ncbi:uncharacterized protein SPPG_07134 [Spizellomyces punctatus DAOM BR117]|uniref:Uncharacterized protein n=1 Tax=Spizellomyces punctatus (strain DAOM BR117) TaxID=645134 RepID=A0A0L0H906_SPIPD|nr:uncharacterized protein SPPG_07134 [Spizellomyces punctatus DAOM BR117]KNC97667.1 hypothetical protein SPPG_07134 [Spizellomyces punctatus DAOM BR117]|eukprot:XP_016605707.1 hypothetical protein SPPG_07134 [Spizellomyces punctatus DAOM BR117]